MRMLCLLGFHRRSRHRAHANEVGYASVCRRCGKPMYRPAGGKWTVIRPEPGGGPRAGAPREPDADLAEQGGTG